LWVVGVLSLLWNAMGAADYTLTELGSQAWLESAGMGPEELAYIAGFPAWAVAGWAIGVWSCLVGSILLLLRSRHAYPAFVIALLGIAIVTYFTYAYPAPASFRTAGSQAFNVALWVATIFFALYARAMARRGVLR
jgi:hypothetical protein